MDRGELEFHVSLARKCLIAGIGMLICAVLLVVFGHLSTKGYIFMGLWVALITFATAKAIQVLYLAKSLEDSGQIHDRIGD